jgi:hypothetical protein
LLDKASVEDLDSASICDCKSVMSSS